MDQLVDLVVQWEPSSPVSPEGIVVDLLSRTDKSTQDILALNPLLAGAVSSLDPAVIRRLSIRDCDVCVAPVSPRDVDSALPLTTPGALDGAGGQAVTFERGDAVLWQLSDIHFGRLNRWIDDPGELAAALCSAIDDHPEAHPDYVLVTGDVSSAASPDEFQDFVRFCETLGKLLWPGKSRPQRIIVVPGNHDTKWVAGGGTDGLAGFSSIVAASGHCLTPWGAKRESLKSPSVEVRRFGTDVKSRPPVALVTLSEVGVELVLLVSSFYSGKPNAKILSAMTAVLSPTAADVSEDLRNLIRADHGEMSPSYLHLIRSELPTPSMPRIAMTHHNLTIVGAESTQNPLGMPYLRALNSIGAKAVLHGHVHLFEGPVEIEARPEIQGLARCLPCTTLASIPATGSNQGFLVHNLTTGKDARMDTWSWALSVEGVFRKDGLARAYVTAL